MIYKIAADGAVSVFLDYAGYTGDDVNNVGTQTRAGRSHVILIGPSCTSRDSEGRIVWCADNDRATMRLEHDGTRTVLADNHEGKRRRTLRSSPWASSRRSASTACARDGAYTRRRCSARRSSSS